MTCEAQGLGKVVGLVLGVGLGSGVDATSRPLQRGVAVLGHVGGRNGLARAGMRACGTCGQGKGSDGQQGGITGWGWHWAGAGNSLLM